MLSSLVSETGRARVRTWLSVVGAAALCWITASSAQAYDLSRAYDSTADEVERGFVVGSAGLWMPEIGEWSEYHQLSFEFGGEFGFRFASIQGAQNFYVVGGFTFSPQLLPRDVVRDGEERGTTVILGYGGIRYLNGQWCFGDGFGCPFFELRLGLVFESSDNTRAHEGPWAAFTTVPSVGYRFSLGNVFQFGARFDVSFSEEAGYGLGWLGLNSFAGFGW
jgi:hypothetical protein